MSIIVLLNSRSGPPTRTTSADDVRAAFAKQSVEVHVVTLQAGASPEDAARQAVADGYETIVAAGGDGTISGVASAVAGTDRVLGVLPLGTLNHFAKDLGLPRELEAAVEVIVHGRSLRIDVAEVNGRIFVNNSSIGLYPALVHEREGQQKLGKGKWSAFVLAMWTVLGRYPLIHVSLKIGEQTIHRKTPLVFVGNNAYELHGLNLGTRRCLNENELCIYVTRDVGRLRLCWFAVQALCGRLRDAEDFDAFSAGELTIATRGRKIRVATDGEVNRLAPPLEYRIRPQSLSVMVPVPPPVADVAATS